MTGSEHLDPARRLSNRARLLQRFASHDDERSEAIRLLEVARSYYDFGMSQAEVAQRMGVSRPTVGRMLAFARATGIVTIHVSHPFERAIELERTIAFRFDFENVIVAGTGWGADGARQVASRCAGILDTVIDDETSLGLTYGRVHAELPDAMRSSHRHGTPVVQLMGMIHQAGGEPEHVIEDVARRLDGSAHRIPAPLLAPDPATAQRQTARGDVRAALERAGRVDVAVIGIGAGLRNPASVFSGVLDAKTVRTLHRAGAVGHILGHFVNANGEPIDSDLERRVVGLPLAALHEIPLVIAVAAGAHKGAALAAAIRADLIDVLILDQVAAQELAHLPEARTHPRTRRTRLTVDR